MDEGELKRKVRSLAEKRDDIEIQRLKSALEQRDTQTLYCIHKIPRRLRNVNKKAYEPEMVAIGPYHREKDGLEKMEELKLFYMRSFLGRNPDVPVEYYWSAIGKMEEEARNCYSDAINLSRLAFIKMLVLDGSFIIELITPGREIRYECTMHGLQRDLVLLENQIPFFVLCKLFDLNQGLGKHGLLMTRILEFCKNTFPGKKVYPPTSRKIEHILDLVHSNWCPTNKPHHNTTTQASHFNFFILLAAQLINAYTTCTQAFIPQPSSTSAQPIHGHSATEAPSPNEHDIIIPSVVQLRDANVKFKKKKRAPSAQPASMSAQPMHGFSATKAIVLDMPTKIIEDGTESASMTMFMSPQATSTSAQPICGYSDTEVTALDMPTKKKKKTSSTQPASMSTQSIHGYSAAEATVLDMTSKIIEDETESTSMSMSVQPIHGYSATKATNFNQSYFIIPSVEQLSDANVKFKKKEYDGGVTVFDVEFKKGVMLMPILIIEDETESMLKNLIAFEQYFPVRKPARITDYALLLDRLINSSKDVQILSEQRIIENHLGSDQEVVDFVNQLTVKIGYYPDNFQYADIFYRLSKHHKKPWNRAMAVLRQDYFSSTWASLSIFAAFLLLLLTIAQTYFAARG